LEKGKNFIFKLSTNVYLLPPNYSSPLHQYILLTLRNPPNYLVAELQGLFNYFASLSECPVGERWDVDLIRNTYKISPAIYPSLPAEFSDPSTFPSTSDHRPPPRVNNLDERPVGVPSPTAAAIANGLVSGADRISGGLNRGTTFLEDWLNKEAEKLVESQPRNQEPARIDPNVVRTLRTVRKASQTASSVTDKAINAIAYGARGFGNWIAPKVRDQGTKLVSNLSGSSPTEAGKKMDDVIAVAAGGFHGLGTVLGSLTESGISLGRTVAGQTSNFIHKRYGQEAGQVSSDALLAAGNVALAATDLRNLGPKALATRAGKEMIAGQHKNGDKNESKETSGEASTSQSSKAIEDKENQKKNEGK